MTAVCARVFNACHKTRECGAIGAKYVVCAQINRNHRANPRGVVGDGGCVARVNFNRLAACGELYARDAFPVRGYFFRCGEGESIDIFPFVCANNFKSCDSFREEEVAINSFIPAESDDVPCTCAVVLVLRRECFPGIVGEVMGVVYPETRFVLGGEVIGGEKGNRIIATSGEFLGKFVSRTVEIKADIATSRCFFFCLCELYSPVGDRNHLVDKRGTFYPWHGRGGCAVFCSKLWGEFPPCNLSQGAGVLGVHFKE